jgi:hypothetical protein
VRELRQILDVQSGKSLGDACREAVVTQKIAISLRRGGIAIGHRNAQSRQAAKHLTQGGILPSNQLYVAAAELIERNNVATHFFLIALLLFTAPAPPQ